MKIREVCTISYNNIKGRKRVGRIISVMFFVALFIYFLINSMATSVDNLVDIIKGMPTARTLTFSEDDELASNFMDICNDIDKVIDVYAYDSYNIEIEGLTEENRSGKVRSYSNAYEEYIVKGEEPEEGEILIPHYLDMSTNGQYEDASQYIGKNITLVTNDYNEERLVYTYKVSGTYDNLYAVTGFETMFVKPEEAVKIVEATYGGVEKYIAEIEKSIPEGSIIDYSTYEFVNKYAVVVDDYNNIEQVKAELKEKLGVSARVEVDASHNELQIMFDNMQFIVSVLTVILLIAVIIMMIVTIGSDIRSRKKEMAMYLVQGYERKNLLQILSVEYAFRLAPILIWAMFASCVILFVENIVIDKFFSMEYQILNMSFDFNTLGVGILILIIVLFTAVFNIYEQIKGIDLLKEIKSEG